MPLPLLAGVGAWLAKSALMQSPIGGFLRAVPRKVWMAIAVAAAVAIAAWAAVSWHGGKVDDAIAAAELRGEQRADARHAAKAAEWLGRINDITGKIRSRNNAKNIAIDRHAVALQLRGPGRAACPNAFPASAAASVGPDAGRGAGSAGMDRMPDEGRPQLAAVPFDDLVAIGRFCALNRQEVIDRRLAEQQLQQAWDREFGERR